VVGVCYKSPSAAESDVNKLFQVVEKAANSKVLIMGDFNFLGINWDTYMTVIDMGKFQRCDYGQLYESTCT
jgi:hypothetical protein